ncbi:uncharacterized protein AC631_04342 [Debaryomyces fabryi]|uniref:Uncharacterized protein n=1 Tax=Debaryomyces fabryi TaxID=58627 RepID=A0A0V1PUJ5_9ASCO|nr:uncharacterized protein AC631_04342 [Debaryomyces fabryi]KRZ99898.1 hypothetical protein AC631_04342 [Debaryomyces fabryi]CUM57481.1 unnamed protein product [Debaryomyces fabryi]
MGNSTDFKGEFTIYPPLTNEQIQNATDCFEGSKSHMYLQHRNAEFLDYHGDMNWEGSWSVSPSGDKIYFNPMDRLYEGKGYLKYLIEHAIRSTHSTVNGEMIFLNEYGSFGILGVENNEVYVIGYLKENDLPLCVEAREKAIMLKSYSYSININQIPKDFSSNLLIPAIFRYDIALKLTRNTEFVGSFNVEKIFNFEKYLMTKSPKEEYIDSKVDEELKKHSECYKDIPGFLAEKEERIRQNIESKYPYIAEHNIDGTVGDKSTKNEWILSDDQQNLEWSGKKFIAPLHWLVFLSFLCFDVRGSIKWVNELNELGLITVERIENLNYGNKNFVFIEFNGKKYLANISWSY